MQLRLVEAPTREAVRRQPDAIAPGASATRAVSRTRTAKAAGTRGAAATKGRPVRARTVGTGRGTVHWADWHLDARTRRVGRAGVAAARAALEQADPKAKAS